MKKNKGSFWKNNIKKIKKGRKERSIKQEAKKKEARIEAEAKKKAKEEIERKEEEVPIFDGRYNNINLYYS